MKKIVTMIQPFALHQQISVYETGNIIDYIEVNIDDVSDKIIEFILKHNINEVNFIGAKQYSKKIGNKIEESKLIDFEKNKIKINYL